MKFDLHTPHEFTGIWWTPGEHERENRDGTMRFAPQGRLDLETTGLFHGGGVNDNLTRNMLGFTRDGQQVTLLGGRSRGAPRSWPGIPTGRYFAHLGLVGLHADDEDPEFAAASVKFSGLCEWWDPHYFTGDWVETFQTGEEANLSIKPQENRILRIDAESFTLTVQPTVSSRLNRYDLGFKADTKILIEPDEPQPLSWFCAVVRKIRLYMWLLQGGKVTLDALGVSLAREEGPDGVARYKFHSVLSGHERLEREGPRGRLFMAITPEMLGDDLESSLNTWFGDYETIRPLVDLYFAHVEKPDLYLQFQIFAMTAGLEGYHRNVHGGGYMDLKDWEKVRRTIRKSFPEELTEAHQESLRHLLHYGHQYSLHTRLEALLGALSDEERKFVTNNSGAFIKVVKDARNHTAHYDAHKVKIPDAAKVARQLEALCVATLWHHVGVGADEVVHGLATMQFPDWSVESDE